MYAVKKIPVGDNKDSLRNMLKEVKLRENLNHRHIVQYKHSWLEVRFKEMISYIDLINSVYMFLGYSF